MAYTSYITIDGMLIGEETNGVMRNYGTDALGSVVTTSLNGVPENTYRYKPYGGLLAKTGTAADPSFLWNGGSGYRATTLPSAGHYVRMRHFSSTAAQWTSGDELWPREGPYLYSRCNPATLSDMSGLTCEMYTLLRTGTCTLLQGGRTTQQDITYVFENYNGCQFCVDAQVAFWMQRIETFTGSGYGCAHMDYSSGTLSCGPGWWDSVQCWITWNAWAFFGVPGAIATLLSQAAAGYNLRLGWSSDTFVTCTATYTYYTQKDECNPDFSVGTASGT